MVTNMSKNNEMNLDVSPANECSIEDCQCEGNIDGKLMSGRTIIICQNHRDRIAKVLACIASDLNELTGYGFEFGEIIQIDEEEAPELTGADFGIGEMQKTVAEWEEEMLDAETPPDEYTT